jgi:hypothetical protein
MLPKKSTLYCTRGKQPVSPAHALPGAMEIPASQSSTASSTRPSSRRAYARLAYRSAFEGCTSIAALNLPMAASYCSPSTRSQASCRSAWTTASASPAGLPVPPNLDPHICTAPSRTACVPGDTRSGACTRSSSGGPLGARALGATAPALAGRCCSRVSLTLRPPAVTGRWDGGERPDDDGPRPDSGRGGRGEDPARRRAEGGRRVGGVVGGCGVRACGRSGRMRGDALPEACPPPAPPSQPPRQGGPRSDASILRHGKVSAEDQEGRRPFTAVKPLRRVFPMN